MSVSNLSFSATLPPFYQTTGYVTNSSQTNIAATGNLSITDTTDPSTGQNTSTVTSNVLSNGISFVSTGSQLNGDLLTVNYTSVNAANSGQDSAITSQLLKTNISGTGVDFTETSSTSHDGIGRADYNTAPNAAYTATVQNAAVSSETTDTAENILLRSFAQVGDSISITYQVSNGSLSNNTVLASSQVPEQTPSSGVATSNPGAGGGPSFAAAGPATIGGLLASSNGLDANGGLASALQSTTGGPSLSVQPNSVLAAALNPAVNLTPSNALSVSDFIDTSLSAFPSQSANPGNLNAAASNAYNAASNTSGSTSPFGASDSGYSNRGSGGNATSSSSDSTVFVNPSVSAGVYSAIANANASTIRGAGVDTIA